MKSRERGVALKSSWEHTLESLSCPKFLTALKGIRRGLEKESLRTRGDSRLATTPHPAPFGSALTHAWITTDFSESLMEFITPVDTDAEKTLEFMTDIHRYVHRHLGDELLWPVSMPCTIEKESDIELANYGQSTVGKMKTRYRRGLKSRYGSMMQAIAGVHYNFSMPDNFWPVWYQIKLERIKGDRQPLQDFISESYFGLIRNFLRLGWMIPYLFGASPAVDATFLKHIRHATHGRTNNENGHRHSNEIAQSKMPLKPIGRSSYYLPKATSLRMSDLGYGTKAQDNLDISYNSLSEFVSGLRQAASQPNPAFKKIGVKRHGEYLQLNANTLQQESELYASIRPKRVTKSDEKLSDALEARGVEYIEVRSLDVNPYAEAGIDLNQMHFLDLFLTYCLLKESPDLSREQQRIVKENHNKVAACGRDLSLKLRDGKKSRTLGEWAEDIFSDLADVARMLDKADQGERFQEALREQHRKLTNPALTPSAKMLQDMEEEDLDINALALSLAKKHHHKLLKTDYTQMRADDFAWESIVSLHKQRDIEEEEILTFNELISSHLVEYVYLNCHKPTLFFYDQHNDLQVYERFQLPSPL